ncbi:MAG: prolyl oligopeptidase family serine peptidase [Bacteroidales bacterium]
MRRFIIFIINLTAFFSCTNKYLNYPYAENNATTQTFFNKVVEDEYKWLELDTERSKVAKKWLKEEMDLCDKFFKKRDKAIYNRINQLSGFERNVIIKSANEHFYYAGLYPFSNKVNIYRYDLYSEKTYLIKELALPFNTEWNLNALVLEEEKYMALIGGTKGESNNLYFYDLKGDSQDPVKIIPNVIDRPLNPSKGGFFFIQNNLASNFAIDGTYTLIQCKYKEGKSFSFINEILYSDNNLNLNNAFDIAYDEKSNDVYIGQYVNLENNKYSLSRINLNNREQNDIISINCYPKEEFNLAGADDINLYLIGTNNKFRGTLYTYDKRTERLDTILHNNELTVQDFSLIKNHALIYYRGSKKNRAYLVNKDSKYINELPTDNNYFYRFYRNKKSETVIFQKESLTTPKDLYAIKVSDISKSVDPKLINDRSKLPFDPKNYITERVSLMSESGNEVNLELTYKKGMIRDGSNPVFICSYLNCEDSFLDKFYLSRVLYMDHGFIYVQRAKSDSKKTIVMDKRVQDIYSTIQYLIKEKYTSMDKVALFGKEYGATAIMQMLNKYPDVKAPTILMDGIYDLVKYNETGRLLYNNERLFHVNNADKFDRLLSSSPYHNVVNKKNYPPLLLMSSDDNLFIPKSHTYKMTAKLQMRTRGYNPIVMLTPDRIAELDEYEHYTYTMFIEHAFWFLTQNLGIKVNPYKDYI